MAPAEIHYFSEIPGQMTVGDGRKYIERTRRQLARLESMKHSNGAKVNPVDAAEIRALLDHLESEIGTND